MKIEELLDELISGRVIFNELGEQLMIPDLRMGFITDPHTLILTPIHDEERQALLHYEVPLHISHFVDDTWRVEE